MLITKLMRITFSYFPTDNKRVEHFASSLIAFTACFQFDLQCCLTALKYLFFYLFIECWPICKNHQFDGGKFGRHPFPPQSLLGSPLSSPLFVIFPYKQPAGFVLVKKGENVVAEFFYHAIHFLLALLSNDPFILTFSFPFPLWHPSVKKMFFLVFSPFLGLWI